MRQSPPSFARAAAVTLLLCVAQTVGCTPDPMPPPPAYYPAPLPDPRPPAEASIPIGVDGDTYADTDPSALTDFQEPLAGHGAWVDDPDYGTVWEPSAAEVGPDFVPYVTAGHWAYDDDYVWVSDWGWGWAPFHYGRWVFVEGHGWCWIPGRVYAGAWVVWRVGDPAYGYLGWAPMPPVWIWRGRVAVGIPFQPPEPRWVFCPRGEVFEPGVGARVVVGERAGAMVRETHVYERPGHVTPLGHPIAQPPMHGPEPASLGIDAARVPHPSAGDPGITHAQSFSRPSTAAPLGAHPPAPHVVKPAAVPRAPAPPARRRAAPVKR